MVLISLDGSAKVPYGLPSQSVNVPALRRRRREKVPSLEFCREGHKRRRDLAVSLQGMRIPFLAINQIYEQPQPKRSIPAAARLAPRTPLRSAFRSQRVKLAVAAFAIPPAMTAGPNSV